MRGKKPNNSLTALRWSATKLGFKQPSTGEAEPCLLPASEYMGLSDDSDYDEPTGQASSSESEKKTGRTMKYPRSVPCAFAITVLLGFLAIGTVFDPERPYSRMFTTLPLPLFATMQPKPFECATTSWPFPNLIDRVKWENPNGNFKGWAPGTDNDIIRKYKERNPDWVPRELPPGFTRWNPEAKKEEESDPIDESEEDFDRTCPDPLVLDPFYNPANDPMKITNLDNDLLEPLKNALKDVKIKHIALILMESMRGELFPLEQGSGFHKLLLDSHDELDHDEANALFSHVTPNIERITGRSGTFKAKNGTAFGPQYREWNDQTKEGFGGVNVDGALTASTVSTKSLAAVHCGSWPLPVDMFEESLTESYQPCLPEILELFNKMKGNTPADSFLEQQWYPAFFQSVTDGYDRQAKFDSQIGFKYIVNKDRIKKDAAKNPELEEINYFGFPETALKTYITDYITNATANNQRMFMSHFTSTSHHPWATPKWFNSSEYMGEAHGLMQTHKDMNSYLNTIRFTDAWIGQLMQIFDDLNIANETLVVFVGDHGQAFKEDFSKTGTYENSHVSNFRVPITFKHPQIPSVQHAVNATSISILPTVLDLLINTGSLNAKDMSAAADIVQDYEGQSLIRPFKKVHKGRRAWNFGLVNPGGRMLTITSADTPYRLVLPLDKKTEYVFSDLGKDPMELDRILEWSVNSLASTVRGKYGDEAADWLIEADQIGLWWSSERKRLWQYVPS